MNDEDKKKYKTFIDCGATHNHIHKKLILGNSIKTEPRMVDESILNYKQTIKIFESF